MKDFQWFKSVIRGYIETSTIIADIYQATLSRVEPVIPEHFKGKEDKEEVFELWVRRAQLHLQSPNGESKLAKLVDEHRYDAGFCVDDISLRRAYQSWINGGTVPQLPRIDGKMLRKLVGQEYVEAWQDA